MDTSTGTVQEAALLVECRDQAEIDYYWNELTRGGDPAAKRCGWLKDEFGVSWQIVPRELGQMMSDPDPARGGRVVEAVMPLTKLDIAPLREAYGREVTLVGGTPVPAGQGVGLPVKGAPYAGKRQTEN